MLVSKERQLRFAQQVSRPAFDVYAEHRCVHPIIRTLPATEALVPQYCFMSTVTSISCSSLALCLQDWVACAYVTVGETMRRSAKTDSETCGCWLKTYSMFGAVFEHYVKG